MTRAISMEFSGKMYLMIILKVTKNQGFNVSLEDIFFEKLQGWGQIDPHHPAAYGLKSKEYIKIIEIFAISLSKSI